LRKSARAAAFTSGLRAAPIELAVAALKNLLSPALSSNGGEGEETADPLDKCSAVCSPSPPREERDGERGPFLSRLAGSWG